MAPPSRRPPRNDDDDDDDDEPREARPKRRSRPDDDDDNDEAREPRRRRRSRPDDDDDDDYDAPRRSRREPAQSRANTVKFTTIIFIVLGLFIPVWPISLPLFWYLAYRSYVNE